MKICTLIAALLCGMSATALPALAAGTMERSTAASAASAAPAAASQTLSAGVVRGVDRQHATLTIEHGLLANIGMPPMTMDYAVANPAWLQGLRAGDAIRFRVENVHGALQVVQLRKSP